MTSSPSHRERAGRLEIRELQVSYGEVPALNGISIDVEPGEAVGILGANGAGKTTLMNTISRLVPAQAGAIVFNGQPLDRLEPHEVVSRGIAHVPEGRRLFGSMSVKENMAIGALRRDDRALTDDFESMFDHFPILRERMRKRGTELSGGQQQMLAIARGLMSNPSLLILDEPSLGLSPLLVSTVTDLIKELRTARHMSVLMAEQNASMALEICDRIYVLRNGRVAYTARTEELSLERVLELYLSTPAAQPSR